MTYLGHVKDGTIVIDEPVQLREGAVVSIQLVDAFHAPYEAPGPTLAERYADFIGKIDDLPPDLSEYHDHYLCGIPRE